MNAGAETVRSELLVKQARMARVIELSRLFDDMDEKALMYDVDSDVVARIGAFILGFSAGKPKAAEEEVEAAKNG